MCLPMPPSWPNGSFLVLISYILTNVLLDFIFLMLSNVVSE